jgi:hypothetical protein
MNTGDELMDAEDFEGQLSRYRPVNHNSKIKSVGLGLLRGAASADPRGGLVGTLGSALGGGVAHVVNPALDEEAARREQLGQTDEEIRRIGSSRYQSARINAQNQKGVATPSQARAAAKQRLQIRARQNGGTLNPNDPETKADLAAVGISNLPAPKTGKGINAAAIQQSRMDGNFYYPALDPETNRYVMRRLDLESGEMQQLTEGERQRLEYERLDNNRRTADYVARYGPQAAEAAGMKIIPDPNEEGGPVSAPPSPVPVPVSISSPAPMPAPSVKPAGGIPPNLYVGPPVGRGRGGRGGRRHYGGASGRGDAIGASLEARDSANYAQQAANAKAQAAAARSRGEDDVAQQWDEAARVAEGNARNVGARRAGGSSRGSVGNLGAQSVGGGLGAAARPKQYTVAEIRAMAQSDGKDPDAAVRYARQNGRLKGGN